MTLISLQGTFVTYRRLLDIDVLLFLLVDWFVCASGGNLLEGWDISRERPLFGFLRRSGQMDRNFSALTLTDGVYFFIFFYLPENNAWFLMKKKSGMISELYACIQFGVTLFFLLCPPLIPPFFHTYTTTNCWLPTLRNGEFM